MSDAVQRAEIRFRRDKEDRMTIKLLGPPCVFCGYSEEGFWKKGTHEPDCPWFRVGGLHARLRQLRSEVSVMADEHRENYTQAVQKAYFRAARTAESCRTGEEAAETIRKLAE